MNKTNYEIRPIGFIKSELTNRELAPKQGTEGAPNAWVEVNPDFSEGLKDIVTGNEVILIAWLHQSARDVLTVHPRGDKSMPLTGVFSTRSPNRPNPFGLHRVTVLETAENKLKVGPIETIDGTPVIDIKPVIPQTVDS